MQGQLFTQDFLRHGICETVPHQALEPAAFDAFVARLGAIFAGRDAASKGSNILDTFPVVRQQDEAAFGHDRSKRDILALLQVSNAGPAVPH